jgi:hypothetical protein
MIRFNMTFQSVQFFVEDVKAKECHFGHYNNSFWLHDKTILLLIVIILRRSILKCKKFSACHFNVNYFSLSPFLFFFSFVSRPVAKKSNEFFFVLNLLAIACVWVLESKWIMSRIALLNKINNYDFGNSRNCLVIFAFKNFTCSLLKKNFKPEGCFAENVTQKKFFFCQSINFT